MEIGLIEKRSIDSLYLTIWRSSGGLSQKELSSYTDISYDMLYETVVVSKWL